MTCFVQFIVQDILVPIMIMCISSFGDWLYDVTWATSIGEGDCEEQFNKIKPEWVVKAMTETSE